MQLELFCADETVRGYEQRIASHVERERTTRLLTASRCEDQVRTGAGTNPQPISRIAAVARMCHRFWCTAMPRRWRPCPVLS